MNLRTLLLIALAAMTALTASGGASAAIFIVNSTADIRDNSVGNGVCDPVGGVGNTCTLRAAIMEANASAGPHTILVASGSYTLTRAGIGEDAAVDGDLDIVSDITISNGTGNPPLIYAANQDRVFDVRASARLRLLNIHVGGGWANAVGNVHGGGFRVTTGGTLQLERAVVATNIANIGGAIYSDGHVEVLDSEFYNNAVVTDNALDEFVNGSAILSRGTLAIERSTFRNNGVIPGGEGLNIKTTAYAIHARDSGPANPSVGLVNVTVVDNTNGVQSEAVPVTMDFVTIARNGFRGLRFLRDLGNLGSVQLRIWHSVIVEHTGNCNGLDGDALEYDVKGGRNASSDASCGFSGSADFENISYPFFGPLDNYGGRTPVLMPRPDSELIDTGGMLCTPSFEDQREVTRPLDGNVDAVSGCDLGAVEYDPLSDPTLAPEIFKDGFE